jgi:flavocytochrome c
MATMYERMPVFSLFVVWWCCCCWCWSSSIGVVVQALSLPSHTPLPHGSTGQSFIPDRIVDVVVIGSGFAGLAAAIEASHQLRLLQQKEDHPHHEPPRVLILEKMPSPGGNSIYNAGQIAAVNTAAQLASGITDDSIERMIDDMCDAGNDLNHRNLLQTMIADSNETIEWTKSALGVTYRDRVTQLGGHSVPRTLSTTNASGRDIIDPMLQIVRDDPYIELQLNRQMTRLITQAGSSHGHVTVCGVCVQPHEEKENGGDVGVVVEEQRIQARRGVILAAGGFGADVEFRQVQAPAFDANVMTTNQPGATAEVLKQALKIGAGSVQLSHIQLGPWTSPDEEGFGMAPFFCMGSGFPYGILIDPATGKRFVNEMGNRYDRSMAILQLGHPPVCIADAAGFAHSLERDFTKLAPAVCRFNTIPELAAHYDINDIDMLQQTIDSYNQAVSKHKDEEWGKALRDDARPIATPPFYAVRIWPKGTHDI